MLETLEHALERVLKDDSLPTCIRIAAQAGLLMVGKYYALTDDNEVYRIAIGMFYTCRTFSHHLIFYLYSNVSRQEVTLV